jgi:citrate lyase subunit beta/citryl-CoA lyase
VPEATVSTIDRPVSFFGVLLGSSLLFVPGNRPDLMAKVGRSRPSAVALDLEDAVPAAEKEGARASVAEGVATIAQVAPVLVRVNAPRSPWFDDDLAAVRASRADGVIVPKLEVVDDARNARARLPGGDSSGVVIAGIETALGVAEARSLLAAGVDGAYFGAEDYVADLGGRRTDDGLEVLYARSRVALFARLAGIPAWDQVVTDFRDDAAFARDAELGRALGYTGKLCIHPAQVTLARRAFVPTDEEVAHARAVLAAAVSGVGVVDGTMVDEVHSRMARAVLDSAERG